MRRFTTVFTLVSLLGFSAAWAVDTAAIKPDTSAPAPITPAATTSAPATTATTPVPGKDPVLSDDSMKVTKDSAGKSTSSLIKDAPVSSDFLDGSRTAPIIMIEYASLSCPHCAHFSNTVLPELQKKYIDTGKMLYILRPFPLNDPALKGAMLLDCVGQQDSKKYYVFAKVLFDSQAKWAFDGNFMAGLETIANVGGLNREQFQSCVNNTEREMRILKIKKDANDELRLPHTPYSFIAGEVYGGDNSVEGISKFVDAKLAEDANKNVVEHAVDKLDRASLPHLGVQQR
jgi:protein-disulfide isomerase